MENILLINKVEPKLKPIRFRAWTGALLWLVSVAVSPTDAFAVDPLPARYRYAEMFEITREIMTRKTAREFLGQIFSDALKVKPGLAAKYGYTGEVIRGFTETQMMLLLQENPDVWDDLRAYIRAIPRDSELLKDTSSVEDARKVWQDRFRSMLSDEGKLENFLRKNNPLEPFRLEMPDGVDGYSELKMYINHPIEMDGRILPADDLRKELIAFIGQAKRKLIFNVFDFDSMEVADALIAAKKRGVEVIGGIDQGVIEARPEVKAVYEKLREAGIAIHAVDSVGLNHQKLMASDWDLPGEGRVSLLSGNYTDSCIGGLGDATSAPAGKFTPEDLQKAIPNANHMIILKSDPMALLIHHEVTKSVDPAFVLRGREFPLSGAFEILGAGEGKARKWVLMAFTPNGGLKSINQNFIGRILRQTEGPVLTAQFAASSPEVEDALMERAAREIANGKEFQFLSVGDKPFAMQDWSMFLSMSDFKLVRLETAKGYVELTGDEGKWGKKLGKKRLAELRKNIRVAPDVYGTFVAQTPDGPVKLTAKLHHKIMVSGQVAIGGSFNFSVGAENNQEYIFAFFDAEVRQRYEGIVRTLARHSRASVTEEALRRNSTKYFDEHIGTDVEAPRANRSAIDCTKWLRPAK